MSDWSNGYECNSGQYTDSTWTNNSDPNRRNYYNPDRQYVSFDQFISQMQSGTNPQAGSSNYNSMQYQNYPMNHYDYENTASSSQTLNHLPYDQQPSSSTTNPIDRSYSNHQNQYSGTRSSDINNAYANNRYPNSTLTPTAVEFVPKISQQPHVSENVAPYPTEVYDASSYKDHRKYSAASDQQATEVSDTSNKKPHSKVNSKEADAVRVFYNSSMSKAGSQDVRNGGKPTSFFSKQRGWAGTQRLRTFDRNNADDEQFANNYAQFKEERTQFKDDRPQFKDDRPQFKDDRTQFKDERPQFREERTQFKDERAQFREERTQFKDDRPQFKDVRAQFKEERTQFKDDRPQFKDDRAQFKEERAERSNNTVEAPTPRIRNKPLYIGEQTGDHKELTQRERLSEQLDKGTLECLVCCERVKQLDMVWSCTNCYHVLHLRCIRKWAMSSMSEGKWRCPACQNTSADVPTEYRCMCGSVRSPEWQRGAVGAHTCGRACRRPRACPHPCTLLCHPGPCPPCQATVQKQCGCGAETRSVLCSSKLAQVCGRVCGRTLTCGAHPCTHNCHEDACEDCTKVVPQVCHCPAAKSREVACCAESAGRGQWACGDTCGRVLACGAHVCRDTCHAPPCPPCALLPDTVLACPCGKMRLEKGLRQKCTDKIPLCGNICAKPLPCGPSGDKHFCKQECHEGNCPTCPDKTSLPCRCGHSSKDVPCSELPQMIDNIFCQKKCNKKVSCGRHRCRLLCCALDAHRCQQVCGRTLSCQLHRCEDFCHTGHCPICPRVSFSELTCECGSKVLLPPVRCGAKPPACSVPCRRHRPCGHSPHHSCHSGDCPPCVVLTAKRCHGNHEERKTIPCSQEEFSCGLPCGKPLSCGKHNCIKTCHKGPCDTEKCTQPCTEKRPSCGHPCGAPCHVADEAAVCPAATPCRRSVRVTCACGRRSQERACADNAKDYAKMLSNLVVSRMQEGGSIEVGDVSRPGAQLKTLECDDECRVEARTRQMALALQIRNPDVSSKLAPRYSEHVRQWAARDPQFAQHVHDKLSDLVQLAKKSKQKTRSHSFPSMNWQKRQFIHELCEHFGCESVAYDAEPNRNVVATADKEKSWLPAMSVMEVLAREAGKRRVPGPIMRAGPQTSAGSGAAHASAGNSAADNKSSGGWATLTSSTWAARSKPKPAEPKQPVIDYFDNPPDN